MLVFQRSCESDHCGIVSHYLSLLQSKKVAHERRILNWEKLYCKVTSAKGHGRRWKYTIDDLKEKTKQGSVRKLCFIVC